MSTETSALEKRFENALEAMHRYQKNGDESGIRRSPKMPEYPLSKRLEIFLRGLDLSASAFAERYHLDSQVVESWLAGEEMTKAERSFTELILANPSEVLELQKKTPQSAA